MRRITLKLFYVFIVSFFSFSLAQGQTTLTWLLTNPTGGTGLTVDQPSGTGYTAASQTQSTLTSITWTGYGYDGAQNCQRLKTTDATRSLPQAFSSTTYAEYALTAVTGYSLSVSTIDMYLGGGGTSSVFAQIKWSTDNFATETVLDAGGTALASNSASAITHKTFASLTIPVSTGSTLKVRVYPKNTGSASTTKYLISSNVKITFTATQLSADPLITKTSGTVPATVMETYALSPVVYGYLNVADDANVLTEWYTDNTYTSTTTAPSGVSLTKDVDANTVTLSGTPALGTAGKRFYKLTVNETNGNSITDSVIINTYVTPTPTITLSSGTATQGVKPGNAITNVVYNLTNVTGGSVTGLPTGLSGLFASTGGNAGTYTISGTVDAGVTPALNNFTLTATPMDGYAGSDITSAGKIVVKKSDAKAICYLSTNATPAATDTKLYPYLNEGLDYMVTIRAAASSAPAATVYDAYDLIILNENVTSTNAELIAVKTVDKPILSLKSFVYSSSSSRWAWGTPDNGKADNATLTVKQPTHPVFNGLTLTDGTLNILSGNTANSIQPVDVTLAGRSIAVATAPKAASPYNMAVAIHDVPATVRGVVNSKFMLIPIADGNYSKITTDGLTLINNAINYLLTGTQFAAPSLNISSMTATVGDRTATGEVNQETSAIRGVFKIGTVLTSITPVFTMEGVGTTVTPVAAADFSNSQATPIVYTVSDMISTKAYSVTLVEGPTGVNNAEELGFYIDGKIIRNINAENLKVYDASGRLMTSSTQDIMMNDFNRGIYIIRGEKSLLKFALTK